MANDNDIKLENIDPEDFDYVLLKIQDSFGFSFEQNDLKDVNTFGELCDIIAAKIGFIDSQDCTTQQAFYKIRNAITLTQHVNKNEINPETELRKVFPRKDRRKKVKQFQKALGVNVEFLAMKDWLVLLLAITFILSLIAFFFSWKIALSGLALFTTVGIIAGKFSKELSVLTVRGLVEKVSREYYRKARRNPATGNKMEIKRVIEQLLIDDFDLHPSVLTKDASLGWK